MPGLHRASAAAPRQAPPADAHIEIKPDVQHLVMQAESVEQFAHQRTDTLRPVRVVVGDAAEQHVVAQRRRGRVFLPDRNVRWRFPVPSAGRLEALAPRRSCPSAQASAGRNGAGARYRRRKA